MHQRPKPCNIYGECFVARAPCRPQAEFWSFGSLPESSERSDMSVKRALGGSKQVARGAEWICMCEKTGDRCKKNKNTCFTYRLVSPQPPQPDWVCFADLKRAESTIKHNEAHKQHMCSKLRQGPNQYIASFAKSWSAGFVGSLKHRMKLLTAWQVSSHSAANMIVIIITITIIIIIIIIIVIFVKSTLFFCISLRQFQRRSWRLSPQSSGMSTILSSSKSWLPWEKLGFTQWTGWGKNLNRKQWVFTIKWWVFL